LVATESAELESTEAKVYPTLTNDYINIELNFENKTEAYYFITDMNGKLMAQREVGEVTSTVLTQNVSNYSAGIYYIDIRTANGSKQIPFTVIK
jgi:hypothetical protein